MTRANEQLSPRAAPPFWRRPVVQQLVPLVASFAFHASIIVLAYLLIVAMPQAFRAKPAIEQAIIPDTNLVEQANAGGVPNPGIRDDPTRAARQGDDAAIVDGNDWATKKSDTLVASLAQGAADTKQNVTPIGVGQASSATVTGLTERGQATAGNLAPFGPAGGGGQGKGLFGLPGGNVKRVAYVCDASGSMSGLRQVLLNAELKRAIRGLRLSQAFNVILFRDAKDREPYEAIDRGALLIATDKNKGYADDFIDRYELRGNSDPLPALRAAFAMKPELIFLLTDGELREPDAVLAELASLNAGKRVKVNTILFNSSQQRESESRTSTEEEGERSLKQIADAHGGTYKLVRPADLQR